MSLMIKMKAVILKMLVPVSDGVVYWLCCPPLGWAEAVVRCPVGHPGHPKCLPGQRCRVVDVHRPGPSLLHPVDYGRICVQSVQLSLSATIVLPSVCQQCSSQFQRTATYTPYAVGCQQQLQYDNKIFTFFNNEQRTFTFKKTFILLL